MKRGDTILKNNVIAMFSHEGYVENEYTTIIKNIISKTNISFTVAQKNDLSTHLKVFWNEQIKKAGK